MSVILSLHSESWQCSAPSSIHPRDREILQYMAQFKLLDQKPLSHLDLRQLSKTGELPSDNVCFPPESMSGGQTAGWDVYSYTQIVWSWIRLIPLLLHLPVWVRRSYQNKAPNGDLSDAVYAANNTETAVSSHKLSGPWRSHVEPDPLAGLHFHQALHPPVREIKGQRSKSRQT